MYIHFYSNWCELHKKIRFPCTRYVRANIRKYLLGITQFCIILRRKSNHILKNSWKKVTCVSRWYSFDDTAVILVSIFGKKIKSIKWKTHVMVSKGVSISVIKYFMASFCMEWRKPTLQTNLYEIFQKN